MGIKTDRPITEKQARARRENGNKGHGPTTGEGKARSAQNATKHGYWARALRAIDRGPLREDRTEMGAFVDAFVAELEPGDSFILRQAALDVADKAWRLTRAQRWEAEGYSASDHAPEEASQATWLRFLAGKDQRHAAAIRLFPDPKVSQDDLSGALCSLSFAVGVEDEDLDWVESADSVMVTNALSTLIDESFADREGAASYLEERAGEREAEAGALESYTRPAVIRREIDGSFARNAERLVSHASREYDRSLKRYTDLFERYAQAASDDSDGGDPDFYADGVDPEPDSDTDSATDDLGIWSHMSADEVVDYITNRMTPNGPEPPRNEPTERNGDV